MATTDLKLLATPTLLRVGDIVRCEITGTERQGEIERLSIPLRPSTDPAAESYYVDVGSCEIGLEPVLSLAGGYWAYSAQVRAVWKGTAGGD